MTFLNPLYLIALAAAAIPIILHLLNLRKARIVEFSTLTFLKELQRSKIRRLKIRQWLLLVLRTLIIIFIVLAFSRPALRGTIGSLFGTHAKTSMVIVLDDSFSMLTSDQGGQLFKQAKARARSIIDLLQPGDEVALVRTSHPNPEEIQFTVAHNSVRAEIDRVQPSYRHATMRDALTAAHVILSRSTNFNKEVHVLTDEQKSHFIDLQSDQQTIALFDDRTKVFLYPAGAFEASNTAITQAHVLNSLFEKNKPVTVAATVSNFGTRALRGEVASLYLNGERVMQRTFDLDAGARKEIEFTATPKSTGFIEGFIEIEDDALPEDNRRYFSFHVPATIRILLAADNPRDAAFIRLALAPEQASGDAVFDITAVTTVQLLSANLKAYDLAIILAQQSITTNFSTRLAAYIKEGGSAFVLPASNADTPEGLNTIASALDLPQSTGMNGSRTNRASFIQFGKIDFTHPLFTGIFLQTNDKKQPQVESPRISFSALLPRTEKLQTVIATSAGSPFIAECRFGNGKVLFAAVAPSLDWSDFPLKGLYVPLMNRSVFYLASRDFNSLARTVGESFDLLLPSSSPASAYTLVSPSKKETRLTPKALPSGLYFPLTGLDEPGNYTLTSGSVAARIVPINIDASESDLTRISTAERASFWKSLGVNDLRVFDRSADVQRAVMETRFGLELWKYMLAAALLCALFEMILARDVKAKETEVAA